MDLFGAVGNLFISLFEILFKNIVFPQQHYIPIQELESDGEMRKHYFMFYYEKFS